MNYKLPDLPFAYSELEPVIDTATMQLHHDKHHAGYVRKLNEALHGLAWSDLPIDELLTRIEHMPADIRGAVRKFGGGHFNHSLFWETLAPPGAAGEPEGDLKKLLEQTFGSLKAFRHDFKRAATGRFGSGWAWLCVDPRGGLHCGSTANQDPCFLPESMGGMGHGYTPILGLDVWEHAYYLCYHNERDRYVDAWWNIIDWSKVEKNHERARKEQAVLVGA